MKWVKISLGSILGLILLACGGLAIAGMGRDSNRIYTSVVIHAKPEAVWPWLAKPDKVKQWVSWLVEIRQDTQGEPAPGQRSVWVREDRNNGNQRMPMIGTVESVEPHRRLAVSIKAEEAFQGTAVYILTDLGDGSTKLESDSRYTFDDGFARFMTPVVCWQAKKKMIGDLEHMRQLVEA